VNKLACKELADTVHVSIWYPPPLKELMVNESLGWRVGGETICLTPNAKEVVRVVETKFVAVIVKVVVLPMQVGDAKTLEV